MTTIKLRLAMRVEGDWWDAYIAEAGTMAGARKIGSILMAAVIDDEDRKKAFMELMQSIMSDALLNATGFRPAWFEAREAPEHERAGRS